MASSHAPADGPANCIFCKIAAGQIPCFKVYEDDVVLAFLDIGPLVKGHTLIIPKAHHATVMEIPPDVLGAINLRIPKISRAVLAVTGAKACHVLVNNGTEAMQSVTSFALPYPAQNPWRYLSDSLAGRQSG